MKEVFNKILVKYRYIFLLYLLIALIFLFKLFLTPGSIAGGDWGFPDNLDQTRVLLNSLFYAWGHTSSIFGARSVSPTLIIFIGPIYLLGRLGLSVALIIKIFLLLIFALAGANMNLFLRKIGLKPVSAFLTGIIFILTSVFFDYALMGWVYVLLSLALLPLLIYLFLRAIDEEKYIFALLASLVFSVAVLQSQTLIWYPLSLFFVVLGYCRGVKQYKIGIKYFFLIIGSFIALNLYWLPALFLLPDKGVSGSSLVWASDSVGTSFRLSSSNIMKLWGGLFNYQFETSYPQIFWLVPFIIPFVAFSSIFFWRRFSRHLGYLLILFLVLILLHLTDRSLIATLPFSNLLRDTSRFIVLTTFSMIAMVGITLDNLLRWKGKKFAITALILFLLFLNTYPFWTGKLFAGRMNDFDFRFRTKEWSNEYSELNNKIAVDNTIDRAFFLPIGGRLSLSDDQRFNGSFSEIVDSYASFSSVPSIIYLTSRGQDASSEYIYQINNAIKTQNISKLKFYIEDAGIDILVLRRNMQFYDWDRSEYSSFEFKVKSLIDNNDAEIYFDRGDIYAIKFKKTKNLISTDDKLVEIKSNFQKILANYISEKVISKDDFLQIYNLPELKNLFGNDAALTFDDQNLTYSKYISKNPSVYQFFPLLNISEKAPMTLWWLKIKNRDASIGVKTKNENEEMISQLRKVNIEGDNGTEYLVYADKETTNSIIYIADDLSVTCPSVVINNNKYSLGCNNEQIKTVKYIDLKPGINTFRIEKNLTPLFVMVDNSVSLQYPPKINFEFVSPTKYKINLSGINDDFILDLADNFNPYWKLTNGKGFFSKQVVDDSNHFVSNGYGNGFVIKVEDLKKAGLLKKESDGTYSTGFDVEYLPQRYLILGSSFSILYFVCLVYLSFKLLRRKK